MNLSEYFAQIAYQGPYDNPDLETLSRIQEHHIKSIPFENLSLHCGGTIVLNMEAGFEKLVRKKRGCCCVENNGLLYWVLKEMGYNMLGTRLYQPSQEKYDALITHLILLVTIDTKHYMADAGFLSSYRFRQPLELMSGKEQPQLPGTFCLTEDNIIWYLDKIGRKLHIEDRTNVSSSLLNKITHQKVYCFTVKPHRTEDFEKVLTCLLTSPKSVFLNVSIVCWQTTKGFNTLYGRTYSETILNGEDGKDLMISKTLSDEEIQHVIKQKFNLILEKKLLPVNNFSHFLLE
ncbi:arylamine N-acetyltransferase, pineal gland isozyme NAT-10-like [Heptranchias perlo]|uniref:arylamine N-acetyltransferase, pineal gland isozyme NAT-10-like n=1 Tax=Heptranchias perlo TaxID=212740 RepID=UPI00355AC03B